MVLSHMQAIADPYQWKWVITGWHSILQNAMVLALCQGDDFQVTPTVKRRLEIFTSKFATTISPTSITAAAVLHDAIPCDEEEQRIHTQRRLYGGDGQASPVAQ